MAACPDAGQAAFLLRRECGGHEQKLAIQG
jgi:hypothetical protein